MGHMAGLTASDSSLTVRVRDEDGRPVSDATVGFFRHGTVTPMTPGSVEGEWTLEPPPIRVGAKPDPRAFVLAMASGRQPAAARVSRNPKMSGPTTVEIELPAGLLISGKLADIEETDVEGARVIAWCGRKMDGALWRDVGVDPETLECHVMKAEAVVDAMGGFRFPALTADTYTLHLADLPGVTLDPRLALDRSQQVRAPARDLLLRPGALITLRILRKNRPLPNVGVVLSGPDGRILLETDRDGYARAACIPWATYGITVAAAGFGEAEMRYDALAPGEVLELKLNAKE